MKYLMSVKDFLKAGHVFYIGDVITLLDGNIQKLDSAEQCNNWSTSTGGDGDRRVVYAQCLQQPQEAEYEYVNAGFKNVFDAIDSIRNDRDQKFYDCNGSELIATESYSHVSIVYAGDIECPIGYKDVYRRVERKMRTVSYPAPESERPEVGSFIFSLDPAEECGYSRYKWKGNEIDMRCLKNGAVYLCEDKIKRRVKADRGE